MQPEELLELRRTKWRVAGRSADNAADNAAGNAAGNAARTLEDAAAFLEEVGLSLLYPHRRPMLVPTFVGAYLGRENDLPDGLTARRAPAEQAADAASEATADGAKEMMVRLLRRKLAFEAPFGPENSLLIAGSTFPFFYALVGDRNYKEVPATGPRAQYSRLAIDAFEVIRRDGPISKDKLVEVLGGGLSEAGIDSALDELWAKLRITRVDYREHEGIFWDVLYRWAPDAVKEGSAMSVTEALSALVSKYLDGVVTADPQELEEFFAQFASRARVKEAVNLLLATREITFLRLGAKTALAITPPREEPPPRVAHPVRIRLPKAVRDAMPSPYAEVTGRGETPPAFTKSFAPKREFPARSAASGRFERREPRADRPERTDRPATAGRQTGDRFERPARSSSPRSGDRFDRRREDRPGRPLFDKSDKFERPARTSEEREGAAGAEGYPRSEVGRTPYAKKPFGAKPGGKSFGAKPFGKKPFGAKPFGDRPGRPPARSGGARFDKPSDRPFRKPSAEFGDSSDAPRREAPASEGHERKPYAKRPFGDRPGRPPARSGGARFGGGAGKPADRSFSRAGARPGARLEESSGAGAERPAYERKPYVKKGFGDRPSGAKPFGKKPFGAKPFGERSERSERTDRSERTERSGRPGRPPARSSGGVSRSGAPRREEPAGEGFERKTYAKKPFGDRAGRPGRAGRPPAKAGGDRFGKPGGHPGSKFAGKPAGKSGAKPGGKPFGKPGGAAVGKTAKKHYGKLKKRPSA